MHSSLAAWRAAASDRDAIARTSIQALLCMAGMTLRVPILAVLRIPQTTFFMLAAVYVYRPVSRGQNQRLEMVFERPPRSLRSRLPLTRSRLNACKALFSPSVRGRAAEGGRGSLTHSVDWVEPDICCRS